MRSGGDWCSVNGERGLFVSGGSGLWRLVYG